MIIIGFGSIGEGFLPLLLRHIDLQPQQITIITADGRGADEAKEYGVEFIVVPVTQENYRDVLEHRLSKGDVIINVSVEVSTIALIELCQEKGAFYIDTMIEIWPGNFSSLPVAERTAYTLRKDALDYLRPKYPKGTTALLTHGANPGLVNHFFKQALLNVARDTGLKSAMPKTREEWAKLSEKLGIKVIHVAERDSQVSPQQKQLGEFVNTWSIDGFFDESFQQPAELGWGTHEKQLPADGFHHKSGSRAAIYIDRPGSETLVRSWTPLEGPYHGLLVSHYESISLPEYFSVYEGDKLRYRPTCHYAYHPCDAALLSIKELNASGNLQDKKRLIMDEITEGMDELGVLLLGNAKCCYWYGSRLTIAETRRLIPYNNATSLQVTASVLAGVIWVLENPNHGVVEADDADFERILEIASPYLGDMVGVWGDWTPLQSREPLPHEELDASDPWQFTNMLVA